MNITYDPFVARGTARPLTEDVLADIRARLEEVVSGDVDLSVTSLTGDHSELK